jgi:hypothetical protein
VKTEEHIMDLMKKRSLFWIGFAIVTILLRTFLKGHPELVEQWYSRGLFQWIRLLSDWTIGRIPIPVLYLMILILPFFFIRKLIKAIRQADDWVAKFFTLVALLFSFAGGVVAIFLWSWGFNYLRVPIETQIGIKPVPLSLPELKEELDLFTIKIIETRRRIPSDNKEALTAHFIPNNLSSLVQEGLSSSMSDLGYPVSGNLPVRTLLKGSLLRIGTAGFYLPFTGECNIDAGLHPLQKPYVLAHEMAHGQGIGDEGSCNFIAYLSCTKSKNVFIKYSGYLSFWRTLAVNYRRQAPEEYRAFRATLPRGIIADLDAINANSRLYPDIFPDLRDRTYDAFLKTQGIKEGMKNYNRVIVLERAFRLKN